MFFATAVLVTVLASWDFEAPDMKDARDFNQSGTMQVPFDAGGGDCTSLTITKVHAFFYLRGSTRGRDRNPVAAQWSGLAITVRKNSDDYRSAATVTIEAGENDWVHNSTLSLPVLSAKQWRELPAETTFVFEQKVVELPKYWKRVTVRCP